MTHADAIASLSVLLSINASNFKEYYNLLHRIPCTTTECNSDYYIINCQHARYITNKSDASEKFSFSFKNSRQLKSNAALQLYNIKLSKINNDLIQTRFQPTVARYLINAINVYISLVDRTQNANIIFKSARMMLHDYKIITIKCRFNDTRSFKILQCSNHNKYNHDCANDVSSGDFHHFVCVESVSERITCSSKRDKANDNSKKGAIERNYRRNYRSNIGSDHYSGKLSTEKYGTLIQYILLLLLSLSQVCWTKALLFEPKYTGLADDDFISDSSHNPYINVSVAGGTNNPISTTAPTGIVGSTSTGVIGNMEKMKNLERSVAAVLIKVAYGTTSTTKRSIPDNTYVPSLTTISTPLLTTLRYVEQSFRQEEINNHHRNYELDLERDHALPTSAPNADILKSNSNPTYPNPNRHYNHERDRQRHAFHTTSLPALPNTLKKNNGQLPTIPMNPGDIPSYSPPARSFFTPPLPPEYQNPFADKPTLRGTHNEGIITNTGSYINRRPIPPPSLMPGHERIPYRPPDLASSGVNNTQDGSDIFLSIGESSIANIPIGTYTDTDIKKALNTPSRSNTGYAHARHRASNGSGAQTSTKASFKKLYDSSKSQETPRLNNDYPHNQNAGQEVLPSIRRILSGSNGNKGEIPKVLLKQVTSRPIVTHSTSPSSPVVLLDNGSKIQLENAEDSGISGSSNINKKKNSPTDGVETFELPSSESIENKLFVKLKTYNENSYHGGSGVSQATSSTPGKTAEIGVNVDADEVTAAATSTMSSAAVLKNLTFLATTTGENIESDAGSSTSSSIAASASHSTWAVAWNIHIYFSVVLFTILTVYSFYKVLTYNKLTHLFSQSYFMCINLILILICSTRIFYLCYDAYNIHSTFNFFVSELLLNLPATFLTISFSVLILYLFLKALNHKSNRYSALIRPLTVVVGCGVHVVLCITLHYVESYTLHNQLQQQLYQQQQLYRRQQLHQQLHHNQQPHQREFTAVATSSFLSPAISGIAYSSLLLQSAANATPNMRGTTTPPRVLSLLCQIIYIFICFFLGFLYLYLYRILKQILRTKSQNYIHGYQNLSYAIHITIATALLFVLLAALQIFGAISISTTRPIIEQLTAEIDWLQWGYQFSLRLIEIAIIVLLSWVTGLKTSSGSVVIASAATSMSNGDTHYGVSNENDRSIVFGSEITNHNREKHAHHQFHHNHSNVAGFFLPCTSSSSQEQFETDYPAVCTANRNLHTYTMRTGKLIYEDGFALNSLSVNGQSQLTNEGNNVIPISSGNTRSAGECHLLAQRTYQRPYDSGSLHSEITNPDASEYGTQSTLAGGGGSRYNHETRQFTDYFTDTTTDHYENPNLDSRYSVSGSGFGVALGNDIGDQKFTKISTTSASASSSGGSGTSAVSQQKMVLLQSDSCYSEPLQPGNECNVGAGNSKDMPTNFWLESCHDLVVPRVADSHKSKFQKKVHKTLDRNGYENPERRSLKSTISCASSTSRCGGYNSFDRGFFDGIRKSGTFNNIFSGNSGIGIIDGRNSSSSSAASSNVSAQRTSDTHPIATTLQHQQQQLSKCGITTSIPLKRERDRDHDREHGHFTCSPLDDKTIHQSNQQQHQQNSDDDMLSVPAHHFAAVEVE